MSATTPLRRMDASTPAPGSPAPQRAWMHALRNELNTAMMAAAASRRLLQTGEPDEALENVRRTEAACLRAAMLLRDAPRD